MPGIVAGESPVAAAATEADGFVVDRFAVAAGLASGDPFALACDGLVAAPAGAMFCRSESAETAPPELARIIVIRQESKAAWLVRIKSPTGWGRLFFDPSLLFSISVKARAGFWPSLNFPYTD
jgi:hypothetical protein